MSTEAAATGAVPTDEPVVRAELSWQRDAFELHVDLAVGAGEVVAVLGPNGAGKTSLLRAIAGLERGVHGHIALDGTTLLGPGVDLPPDRRGIGLMFQEHLLFPHLTARDNVAFGLRCRGRSRAASRSDADAWLERFDLGAVGQRLAVGFRDAGHEVRNELPGFAQPLGAVDTRPFFIRDTGARREVAQEARQQGRQEERHESFRRR